MQVAQVKQDTDTAALLKANPWLTTTKLVVKPDMLFGQVGWVRCPRQGPAGGATPPAAGRGA